jgi:hypothetical protein
MWDGNRSLIVVAASSAISGPVVLASGLRSGDTMIDKFVGDIGPQVNVSQALSANKSTSAFHVSEVSQLVFDGVMLIGVPGTALLCLLAGCGGCCSGGFLVGLATKSFSCGAGGFLGRLSDWWWGGVNWSLII